MLVALFLSPNAGHPWAPHHPPKRLLAPLLPNGIQGVPGWLWVPGVPAQGSEELAPMSCRSPRRCIHGTHHCFSLLPRFLVKRLVPVWSHQPREHQTRF